MIMIKQIFFSFMVLGCAMMMSLTSCDKIKEATSHDFTVKNVNFDFTAITNGAVSAVVTRADGTTSFSETRMVDISEISSSELAKYVNKINKVRVNSSQLTVTMIPAGIYTVTNLTISAVGVPGSIVIPSYTLGEAFIQPLGMDAYTSAFIVKLIDSKKVEVTVSGTTNAPEGTTVKVSYKNELLFTASLL